MSVKVTATDPGGLEAIQEAMVAVVERVRIFQDDFETDESLDNWEDYSEGGADFEVSEGRFVVKNLDPGSPAFVGMELEAQDWEVRVSMANGTSQSWVQVGIGTGTEPVLAYLFQLGADPDTVWGAPETNYRLLVATEEDLGILEGASGESDVVKDLNELMETRLSVHGGELSIWVDGTELFSTELGSGLPNSMVDMIVGVWPAPGTTGKVGVFDWVEVLLGPPPQGDRAEMEIRVPRRLAPSLRYLPGGLSEVEVGGTVRIEDGRVVRSGRVPGSWRRR